MHYTHYSYSHSGKRLKNEDDFFPRDPRHATDLFIVCDGIGGHGDGDLASRFVADELGLALQTPVTFENIAIEEALAHVNNRLNAYAASNGNPRMGSTAALLKGNGKKALVGWVGDSRIYHFREDKLKFRSTDHTLAELLFENGEITAEEFENYPMRHIIWQALGAQTLELQPGIELLPDVQPGDRFLLATDGLLNVWSDSELQSLFKQDSLTIFQNLTARALNSARDNFTFTIVEAHA